MKHVILEMAILCLLSGCVVPNGGPGSDSSSSQSNSSGGNEENQVEPLPTPPLGIPGLSTLANPPSAQAVRLGRWLFFDNRLSADNTISCSSCHQSAYGFSSNTSVGTGIDGQLGTRKPPPLINLAWVARPFFFWDGRANSLEAQAVGPITNPIEMGMTESSLVAKLQATSYPQYFSAVFGTSEITLDLITQAIADYELTRQSGDSAFDQFRAGKSSALSASAQQGFALFGQVGCNHCHNGVTFSDANFHNTGIAWDPTTQTYNDPGRFDVTSLPADEGAFKTPTLREVSLRAPYMHNGSVESLTDVVEFYNQGGISNPNLDPLLGRPLGLSGSQVTAIVDFLESLAGSGYADTGPTSFPQ